MKYCNRGTLEDIIPEDKVLNFMKQILLSVVALYKNKIIHRDLEAGNILIDGEGNLKLSDFGTSKELSGFKLYAETAKGMLGHSSIEVIKGEKYNFSTDIWSLGCILHELCCLRPPFTEENLFIFIEWWKEKRYDASVIPKNYSEELKGIIVSILNLDRKKRPTCEILLSNKLFGGMKLKVHQLENKYEGNLKMRNHMEEARIVIIVVDMKVGLRMVEEQNTIRMIIGMKVNLKMIINMVKEHIIVLMEIDLKMNLRTI
jgi:serine/threonine protein kinase